MHAAIDFSKITAGANGTKGCLDGWVDVIHAKFIRQCPSIFINWPVDVCCRVNGMTDVLFTTSTLHVNGDMEMELSLRWCYFRPLLILMPSRREG